MDTDKLIASLTENADPVRRLPSPWVRTAAWFAMAVPYVAVIVMMMAPRDDLAVKFTDLRYLVEQIAALCTAIGAAVAAFQSIVPGYDRRFLLLPLVPLSVWLASVGEGCVEAWLRGGAFQDFTSDFLCIPAIALVGTLPAVAMALMLRKGAPLCAAYFGGAGGSGGGRIGQFRSSSLPRSGRKPDGAGLAGRDSLHADDPLRMGSAGCFWIGGR